MPSIPASAEDPPLLELAALRVEFATARGNVAAVNGIDLQVRRGECLGIVGESGAGKSQALLAACGLLASNGVVSGAARFEGVDLLHDRAARARLVGARIALVFQDPMTSLTPHLRIGEQIAESLRHHRGLSRREARMRAIERLGQVRIADPVRRASQYPHELSGGMRQRVHIAAAIACEPSLLIADEPTTALDVTVQAQILALLKELQRERAMALVLVTHDLGVVAGCADRITVMRHGAVVETGTARQVLKAPSHAYTRELIAAMPRLDAPRSDPGVAPGPASSEQSGLRDTVISARGVQVHFDLGRGSLFGPRRYLRAVDGVDVELPRGGALGIVGESGCGKSTLMRAILRLVPPSAGRIVWLGRAADGVRARELRTLRSRIQPVFQDPLASLDPRMTISEIVAEPLRVHRAELGRSAREGAVLEMLTRVGLPAEILGRYPHELSGGQCQRVGIARALILRPAVLVCDEPVSALDLTIQAQVVALLEELRHELGAALIFVSHNLAVVRQLCDRVLVLYLGKTMEAAPAEQLFAAPRHPYTRALLDAVPICDPDIQPARFQHTVSGEPPSPAAPPSGCVFRTRCPHALDVCRTTVPPRESAGPSREVACHRWRELIAVQQPTEPAILGAP